ncbi:MAG TPA: ATP-binding cassette domain-containing protein [Saprospiraceae bacterium]|nr:ATP-binding cassette domain-containing protein [Saprospiraceae bacterium]HPN70928.1 ATP-binding cassette domain-containing protein [Saprospiraceae bacterium]
MSYLEINNVVKQYGDYFANDHITFDVGAGKLFGLLGPNGAGKTTLIRIITAITRPDSGTVKLGGKLINDDLAGSIGYMPEERGLYKKMKIADHLIYLGQLKGLKKNEVVANIKYWFDKFEIADWRNKNVEELSKGMQQKVQFIATVLHKPGLLILDEPFSGLDPVNANLIKDEIYNLNKQGTTIIFSTHRMEQVEEICEEIVLVNKGKVILNGNVDQVKESFKENKYLFKIAGENIQNPLPDQFDVLEHHDNSMIVKSKNGDNASALLRAFINQGTDIKEYREILPGLNEIFIKQVTTKESL